jgi:hypothetical protein
MVMPLAYCVFVCVCVLGVVGVVIVGQNGWTALMLACQKGKMATVAYLSHAGSAVNFRSEVRYSPFPLLSSSPHHHPENMPTTALAWFATLVRSLKLKCAVSP